MPKKRDITSHQRSRRYHDGVAAVNAAVDAAGVATALAAHGRKLDLDMVAYGDLTAANKVIIDAAVLAGKAVDDYENRNAVAAVFDAILVQRVAAQFAVGMVNAVLSAAKMGAVLEQYAEVLGLELDDYNVLIDKNKETVCGDVLTGKPYADEAAVKTAFDAAVATALETQALADINAATAETMAAAITTYVKPLGLDLTDYDELEEAKKGEVHAAVVAGQTYADKAAVKTAFDAAVLAAQEEVQALAAINAATAETMAAAIATYADALGLDLTDYDELGETGKGEVHTAMVTGQPFADKAAVKTAFDAAVLAAQEEVQALAAINAATAETMAAAIATYADALGLDLTDYDELGETGKGEVHTAMVTGQPFADKAAVKTAFDAAVLAAQGE